MSNSTYPLRKVTAIVCRVADNGHEAKRTKVLILLLQMVPVWLQVPHLFLC